MRGFDEVGGMADGELYCEDCWEEPGEDDRCDGGPVFRDDMRGGATCGGCGACWVDGDWETHQQATADPPAGPRWYTCEGCGHQHPTRERDPGRCSNCGAAYARIPLRIVIDISTENAAFDDPEELASLLETLAGDLAEDVVEGSRTIVDSNGNRCGTVRIEEV